MAKTILNIMLARGKGGLEQALLDYSDALTAAGYNVINVVHPQGWACSVLSGGEEQERGQHTNVEWEKNRGQEAEPLVGEAVRLIAEDSSPEQEQIASKASVQTLSPLGEWDPFAARKLRRIAEEVGADAAICHGNRAIGLALRGLKGRVPVYAVAHNYKIRRFPACDGAFCITRDLIEELVRSDMKRDTLFHMPNLVRAPEVPATAFTGKGQERGQETAPLVGEAVSPIAEASRPEQGKTKIKSMGRFVEKKGFTYYIQALAILKQRGHSFTAELGGDGLLAPLLEKEARTLGLTESDLRFTGWVQDKDAFWRDTDIFVLPSLHEPFGIVLIEAMSYALPCVTTDSEGPCEIINNGNDALLARKGNAASLADQIEVYLQDNNRAREHGLAARQKCLEHYSVARAAERIKEALD